MSGRRTVVARGSTIALLASYLEGMLGATAVVGDDDAAYEHARLRIVSQSSRRYHPDLALSRLLDCYRAILMLGVSAIGGAL